VTIAPTYLWMAHEGHKRGETTTYWWSRRKRKGEDTEDNRMAMMMMMMTSHRHHGQGTHTHAQNAIWVDNSHTQGGGVLENGCIDGLVFIAKATVECSLVSIVVAVVAVVAVTAVTAAVV